MDSFKVILHFASWCGHCTTFKPIWNELKQLLKTQNATDMMQNKVIITFDEFDENHEKTLTANISGYPTILIYKNSDVEPKKYPSTGTYPRSIEGFTKYFKDTYGVILPTDKIQSGGDLRYYQKYMKYKLKYLNSKH